MPKNKHPKRETRADQNFREGFETLKRHPLFRRFAERVRRLENQPYPNAGWASVSEKGYVYVHPTRLADPPEWVFIFAHCLLHLGFGHFRHSQFKNRARAREWNVACDCVCAHFLGALKIGRAPEDFGDRSELPARSEEQWFEEFCSAGIPESWQALSTAGKGHNAMIPASQDPIRYWSAQTEDFQKMFAEDLAASVSETISSVAGAAVPKSRNSKAEQARAWFIDSYPLLGALGTSFEIIEDPVICQRLGISIAAVNEYGREIYLNPAAGLSAEECRFVIAHELLHVGLRHHDRQQGRHPFLWNVACDFVINGWLIEMEVGLLPAHGSLYDPALKGESSEAIYDHIVQDMRRYRKVATLAGFGAGDILERRPQGWSERDAIGLDEFCRRCLIQGLEYHQAQARGYLPAGLIEEIRALSQPPIPWDVELAKWFDRYFEPLEKARTYARVSRRQSATPDIPRPRWTHRLGSEEGRTFGVVLDTSGSMDRQLLGKALGAIVTYSLARQVPAVRVVYCDAIAYDQGYVQPEAIADRVAVKGRGGTVLQPGIDLLDGAPDFPKDAPVLIITDGACDVLRVRREHGFLIPKGARLPFRTRGKVFRVE